MSSWGKKVIIYWLPPLIWTGIIFYFSSQQRVSISHSFWLNFIFFKLLHIGEYAVLYGLWWRAVYFNCFRARPLTTSFRLAFFLLVVSAVFDETHQRFIPTRQGAFRDICIDILGAGIMYIYIKSQWYWLKKIMI